MEFKPEKINNDFEKKRIWDEWKRLIDITGDKLNYPIDSNIKEPVIALNALGFVTDGSCEGHIDRGLPYPWIDIEGVSDFNKKYPEYEKIVKILKEKTNSKLEAKRDYPDLYNRALELDSLREIEIAKMGINLNKLINDFYLSHKPYSSESRILATRGPFDFRIEPISSMDIGHENKKIFDEKIAKMSPNEKKQFLENNQKEMKSLSEFLKNKFFGNK